MDRNYESLQEGAPTKKANAHIEHENRADPLTLSLSDPKCLLHYKAYFVAEKCDPNWKT